MKKPIFIILFAIFAIQNYAQTQLGANINGEAAGDYSGWPVSISADGSIVAIGAVYNAGFGFRAGHVRVYKYSTNTWTQLGADIDGKAVGEESAIISLSADGNIVAIGAPKNDTRTGKVRVYKYTTGVWTQLGADIDGDTTGDYFGWSVSISSDGSIVAIGGNKSVEGYVKVYQYATGAWTQLGGNIEGNPSGDLFGGSVSLSSDGKTLAIGAIRHDSKGSAAGQVRVYKYATGIWTQLGGYIDGEADGDHSGNVSLTADGSIVAIGGTGNDGNGNSAGHVRVYQFSTGTWTQLGTDIDGEAAGDNSGAALSFSADGKILAIGAYANDGNGNDAGHARVYRYTTGGWNQVGVDIDGDAAENLCGEAVALSADGRTIAVSSSGNSGNGKNAGHVRVYSLSSLLSYQTNTKDADVSVYPNPAGEQLVIHINSSFIGTTYSIANMLGGEIKTGILLSENTQVDLDDLPAGSYIFKIIGGSTTPIKLIKL